MDLRRHNRGGSRQYMQPSPQPQPASSGAPQLFEDTSGYSQPGAGSSQGWQGYDIGDVGPQETFSPSQLPPYDPFGQMQQQPHLHQSQSYNNVPMGGPLMGGAPPPYSSQMGSPMGGPMGATPMQGGMGGRMGSPMGSHMGAPMGASPVQGSMGASPMQGSMGASPMQGSMGASPMQGSMGAPMGTMGGPNAQMFMPGQLLNDPMAAMAMQYGQALAGQGREIVHEKIERYVSISKLKVSYENWKKLLRYYFAVDTSYVYHKLVLLLFPYVHKDWAPKYNQEEEPVAPRYDINAPDLYIPTMAFVSYILLSAYMMGLEERFSPEVLGMQASWSLGCLAIETMILLSALYLLNINTSLKLYDLVAFCGYKFVPMIVALMFSLFVGATGYYGSVLYSSLALGFFLLRTLRIAFLSNPGTGHFGEGSRRSLYLLLVLCVIQPFIIWFMTHGLVIAPKLPPTS